MIKDRFPSFLRRAEIANTNDCKRRRDSGLAGECVLDEFVDGNPIYDIEYELALEAAIDLLHQQTNEIRRQLCQLQLKIEGVKTRLDDMLVRGCTDSMLKEDLATSVAEISTFAHLVLQSLEALAADIATDDQQRRYGQTQAWT